MIRRCRICGTEAEHPAYRVAEQMFQLGDVFDYFQCQDCGCLQIAEPPADWGRYYPKNYYSFNLAPLPQNGLRATIAGWRDRAFVRSPAWIAAGLAALRAPALPSLRPLRPALSDRILDVGCGNGQLLSALRRAGFRHLAGVDAYVEKDLSPAPGVKVARGTIHDLPGEFELIMLNHVLEHVDDGRSMLTACRDHLSARGKLFVRIPVGEGEAWRRYREHAVQVDAPRHYCLHTRKSFALLADQAGLQVEALRYDSGPDQFWISELYQRGIPLMGSDGRLVDPGRHFSAEQLQSFAREARRCNESGEGNHIAAVLSPKSPADRSIARSP